MNTNMNMDMDRKDDTMTICVQMGSFHLGILYSMLSVTLFMLLITSIIKRGSYERIESMMAEIKDYVFVEKSTSNANTCDDKCNQDSCSE